MVLAKRIVLEEGKVYNTLAQKYMCLTGKDTPTVLNLTAITHKATANSGWITIHESPNDTNLYYVNSFIPEVIGNDLNVVDATNLKTNFSPTGMLSGYINHRGHTTGTLGAM